MWGQDKIWQVIVGAGEQQKTQIRSSERESHRRERKEFYIVIQWSREIRLQGKQILKS